MWVLFVWSRIRNKPVEERAAGLDEGVEEGRNRSPKGANALFLVTFLDPDSGEGLHTCPRALLQKIIGHLKDELDVKPFAGAEFEFFQFKGKSSCSQRKLLSCAPENPTSAQQKQFRSLDVLTPGMHGYSMLRTQ